MPSTRPKPPNLLRDLILYLLLLPPSKLLRNEINFETIESTLTIDAGFTGDSPRFILFTRDQASSPSSPGGQCFCREDDFSPYVKTISICRGHFLFAVSSIFCRELFFLPPTIFLFTANFSFCRKLFSFYREFFFLPPTFFFLPPTFFFLPPTFLFAANFFLFAVTVVGHRITIRVET